MSDWTIFGERLSHIMQEYEVSLRELSRRTGITVTTLHRYATCKRVPRATEIMKCSDALGVTCDYLLGLSDDPHLTGKGERIKGKGNKCTHEHCPLQYNYVSDDCDISECPWKTVRKQGYWTEIGKDIYVNLEIAREQYKVLGYPHRVILKLQCSECRMITCVDSSIAYEFCPHCGADMREENHEQA